MPLPTSGAVPIPAPPPPVPKIDTRVTEPPSLRKGVFDIGLANVYSKQKEESNVQGFSVICDLKVQDSFLSLRHGVTERFEFRLDIPYFNDESTISILSPMDNSIIFSKKIHRRGIGDIALTTLYQFIPGKGNSPFFLVGGLRTTLPTAEDDYKEEDIVPTGSGAFQIRSDIFFKKILFPLSIEGGFNINFPFKGKKIVRPRDKEESEFQNRRVYNASLFPLVMLGRQVSLGAGLAYGGFDANKIEGVKQPPESGYSFMIIPTLTIQLGQFRISQQILVPISSKNAPDDISFGLFIQFRTRGERRGPF